MEAWYAQQRMVHAEHVKYKYGDTWVISASHGHKVRRVSDEKSHDRENGDTTSQKEIRNKQSGEKKLRCCMGRVNYVTVDGVCVEIQTSALTPATSAATQTRVVGLVARVTGLTPVVAAAAAAANVSDHLRCVRVVAAAAATGRSSGGVQRVREDADRGAGGYHHRLVGGGGGLGDHDGVAAPTKNNPI